MQRIPATTLDAAPDASQDTLRDIARRTGGLINIHATMASSPAVLAAYVGISAAIAEHGSLSGRVREAVALGVAATNRFDYCQAAHTRSGAAAGQSAEEMVQIRAGKDLPDQKVSAAVQVARDAAAHDGYVESTTWAAVADAGWSEEELAEMFLPIIANVLTNYFNHYARTDLDLPPAPAPAPAPSI